MIVCYYHRKPHGNAFSIEGVFRAVCEALPSEFQAKEWFCRFHRGIAGRLYNVIEAAFRQGTINHVVGDVHYLVLSLPKRRTILTIHDCVSPRTLKGFKQFALVLLWYKLPVARCAAVTTVSEFSKQEVLHYVHCAPERIRVIHDPVARQFVPDPKPFNVACPIILQVGTGRNKNIPRVAEAIDGLRCHLDIIGRLDEPQRQVLSRHGISYSESWNLTTEQVAERYRRCDLVVFASTYEGFGLPIVEANATGRPVITSNICSMPEIAGSAACLVDPFDCTSVREGILRVIGDADYRSHLVAEGFENVKRFQADVIAAQYAVLYREVFSCVTRDVASMMRNTARL
jgi:glycosyltransferase involved in cell wall biosynthesis